MPRKFVKVKKMEFVIDVAENGMEAILHQIIASEHPAMASAESVMDALRQIHIAKGVHRDAIASSVEGREAYEVRETKIASGKPPVDGTDARVEYLYEFVSAGTLRADGSVDVRSRQFGVAVAKDQVIARKYALTRGVDGYNIFGKILSAKPAKDVQVKAGPNVSQVQQDGAVTEFVAAIGGILDNRRPDELIVSDSIFIEGNVDHRTGNIDYDWSVAVQGDVMEGFSVKSGGSVEIMGSVRPGANVHAVWNVQVEKAVEGGKTEVLSEKGNIAVGRVEEAKLVAAKNIIVKTYMLGANVRCGGVLNVLGEGIASKTKGAIMGGRINAVGGIDTASAGSPNVETRLIVGVDLAVQESIEVLMQAEIDARTDMVRIQRSIGFDLSKGSIADEINRMIPGRRKMVVRLLEAMKTRSLELEKIMAKLYELRQKDLGEESRATVKIQKFAVPDIDIRIGKKARHHELRPVSKLEYYLDPGTGKIQTRTII